jgi:hypothetical protein
MGAQSMEELKDLDLQTEGTTMKMTKRRWEHHAFVTDHVCNLVQLHHKHHLKLTKKNLHLKK